MEILHDFTVMHERWKVLRDWKIREAHHLLARIDNSGSVHGAVAFFFGKAPQAPDLVFLFETNRFQAVIIAGFNAG